MGAGYHGGFGATMGSAKTRIVGYTRGIQNIKDKTSLINGIDKVNSHTSDIVSRLREGKIKLTILGDDLFEAYLGLGEETAGYTVDNHMYLRMSSINGLSDLVHEGTHALDHVFGVSRRKTLIENEIKAYKKEHEFQKAAGLPVEFSNDDEIRIYVYLNYYVKENKK